MSEETLIAECALCETYYTTFRKLRRHFKKRHADLEVLECNFCDFMTHDKVMFKQHKEMLHPDKKFVCKKCGFKTHQWTWMERHFDKHATKSTAELSSSEHLEHRSRAKEAVQAVVDELIHLQEIKDTRFQCDSCDKYFTFKSKLKKHFRYKHTQDRPFKCSLCDFAGKTKNDLTNHMSVHSDERPFKCCLCDYAGKAKRFLTSHMRVHTDERPLKCKLCDCKFKWEESLKCHMNFHLNIRNFASEICDHKSRSKQFLQRHMRTHTGERPYNCYLCEKAFSKKYILKRHLKHVHFAPMK